MWDVLYAYQGGSEEFTVSYRSVADARLVAADMWATEDYEYAFVVAAGIDEFEE